MVPASTSAPVLVTGASGFLGRHVLERRQGAPTAVLVRSRGAWKAWSWTRHLRGVELIEGSLDAPERWWSNPALNGVEQILHLAAHVEHSRGARERSFRVNVDGTATMLELAASRGARLLFVSTSGTVGCSRQPEVVAYEDASTCIEVVGDWPYYASKIEAERRITERARELGTELVIVRPPVLLGPGDHRLRSSGHVLRVLEDRLPFRLPGGIAFVDVRDVATALARLLGRKDARPIYHLPGHHWPLDRFFGTVAELAGRRLPRTKPPAFALRGLARGLGALPSRWPRRLGLPDPVLLEMGCCYWGLGSHYAESELGHVPRPAEATLSETLEWLRAYAVRQPS